MALENVMAVDNGKILGLHSETAANVPYDNTESELTSTDVQGAIDELNASIPSIQVKTYTTSAQTGATNVFYISAPTLPGYTLLAHWVLGVASSDGSSLIANVYNQGTATSTIELYWYSKNGNSLHDVKVKTCALFIKN